ncbi:hypothetical protein BDP27DRAFT_1369250 [Rhodocollybia butyracea]|uniref:Uncharacterized protein n=1 Tax=Rhodocollybia butyracea TaxID=206335 RepID=A0A9P5PFS6_9AGAR|nr:hypothetical protein BDP27DRAFT_1369250 [Rhodocollybia butyracea]
MSSEPTYYTVSLGDIPLLDLSKEGDSDSWTASSISFADKSVNGMEPWGPPWGGKEAGANDSNLEGGLEAPTIIVENWLEMRSYFEIVNEPRNFLLSEPKSQDIAD